MNGSEGNSEFCLDEVERNIEIRGKYTSLFSKAPVIKWFVIELNKTKATFE